MLSDRRIFSCALCALDGLGTASFGGGDGVASFTLLSTLTSGPSSLVIGRPAKAARSISKPVILQNAIYRASARLATEKIFRRVQLCIAKETLQIKSDAFVAANRPARRARRFAGRVALVGIEKTEQNMLCVAA